MSARKVPASLDAHAAQQLVDVFIPGLLARAGINAKIAKTKSGRTIKIRLADAI